MKKIIIRFNAPVILSFALLSLIALLLGNWTNGAATTQYFSVYRSSLADPLTYVRFFGHVLGHSGYDHYMGNMLLLLLVGPGLEEKYRQRHHGVDDRADGAGHRPGEFYLLSPHGAAGRQRRGVP